MIGDLMRTFMLAGCQYCVLFFHFMAFLILCQNIMKDRWINMGYEERDLKPYKEPPKDLLENKRIGTYGTFQTWQREQHACDPTLCCTVCLLWLHKQWHMNVPFLCYQIFLVFLKVVLKFHSF